MFNVGDKVTSVWEPNKIGVVKSISTIMQPEPVYTILYEDGNEYANYVSVFKKIITSDDVLRYGEVLTDDNFTYDISSSKGYDEVEFTRIRTIRYESRIFYHKMISGEVVAFKELTV